MEDIITEGVNNYWGWHIAAQLDCPNNVPFPALYIAETGFKMMCMHMRNLMAIIRDGRCTGCVLAI